MIWPIRLIIRVGDRPVVDLELMAPVPDEEEDKDGPSLQATGGGEFSQAEPYGDPATVHGFGF